MYFIEMLPCRGQEVVISRKEFIFYMILFIYVVNHKMLWWFKLVCHYLE